MKENRRPGELLCETMPRFAFLKVAIKNKNLKKCVKTLEYINKNK